MEAEEEEQEAEEAAMQPSERRQLEQVRNQAFLDHYETEKVLEKDARRNSAAKRVESATEDLIIAVASRPSRASKRPSDEGAGSSPTGEGRSLRPRPRE